MGGRPWLFRMLGMQMASCMFRTTQQILRAIEIFCLFYKVAKSLIFNPTIISLENPEQSIPARDNQTNNLQYLVQKTCLGLVPSQILDGPLIEENFCMIKVFLLCSLSQISRICNHLMNTRFGS
jgi:hypothetical protein